jgi:hypothetical protein
VIYHLSLLYNKLRRWINNLPAQNIGILTAVIIINTSQRTGQKAKSISTFLSKYSNFQHHHHRPSRPVLVPAPVRSRSVVVVQTGPHRSTLSTARSPTDPPCTFHLAPRSREDNLNLPVPVGVVRCGYIPFLPASPMHDSLP